MTKYLGHSKHIEILALGDSRDGGRFLALAVTVGGVQTYPLLSLSLLQASDRTALAGLELLTTGAKAEFMERVQIAATMMPPTFDVATKSGWCGRSFVYPNGCRSFGGDRLGVCLPHNQRPYGETFTARGSVEEWIRVAEMADGNSLLMLSIALAFVGPILAILEVEAPMIQLVGAPGTGKSCIAAIAGSVWGWSQDGRPFGETWNHTGNNLELVAAALNETLLVLDETRASDKKLAQLFANIGPIIFRLAAGTIKGRLTEPGAPVSWRTPILSTSNYSLDEMAGAARAEIDDALRDRLIDVPLPVNGHGAFEDIRGFRDLAEFAVALLGVARDDHGVAGIDFVESIMGWRSRDETALKRWLIERRVEYIKFARRAVRSTASDLTRRHGRFATIYAAGSLAFYFGILPWNRKALANALVKCERAHVALVEKFSSSCSAPA